MWRHIVVFLHLRPSHAAQFCNRMAQYYSEIPPAIRFCYFGPLAHCVSWSGCTSFVVVFFDWRRVFVVEGDGEMRTEGNGGHQALPLSNAPSTSSMLTTYRD